MFGLAGRSSKERAAAEAWGYRIHDGAAEFRFQLEGALKSGDVGELDQCWHTAASTIGSKTLVIDLTGLTAIDEPGRELLDRWRRAGAEFVGAERLSPAPESLSAARVSAGGGGHPALRVALPWTIAALTLLFVSMTLRAADSVAPAAEAASPTAPNLALSRYFASLENSQPWGQESVEIEAALPKLKEQGRLRAIRRLLPHGKPQYQVFEQDGSRTVRQQVIARYLTAEVESAGMAPSSVSVSPENYRFHYEGSVASENGLEYVFQITPKQKRTGMIQGMLWIDAQNGSAIRLSGYLVKKPSIFIKRVDVTRETSLHDGVAQSRVTHLALDTRLVGRAELVIHERPCVECGAVGAVGEN